MRTATLYIAAEGVPYATVEDVQILEGDITRATAVRDGALEQEQVEVQFLADALGAAALPHGLPEGRLRAQLTLGTDVVMNGTTQRELVACSSAYPSGERVWTVRVQNEARRELDERLEALDLEAIKGSAGALALSTLVGAEAVTLSWYSLPTMATAALSYVATLTGTLPLFRSGIRYLDAGAPAVFVPPDAVYVATAPDPERDDTTYPKGTAKALLDALAASHGWTLRAAYAPYPSSALVVEVGDGRWTEATPTLVLDALAEEDWDVSVQPAEREDLALSMEVGATDPAHGYLSDMGGYAARAWRRDAQGQPVNRTVLALAPLALPGYEWGDVTTETVAYDAAYTETQYRARPVLDAEAKDAWHLLVVRGGKGIFERRPSSPAPGFATQLETWPGALYPAHALSAYSRVEVRGVFDVEGVALPGVGSAGRVGVDGLSLAVVEASINEDTFSATLTLARPVPEYDAVASMPPALPPVGLRGVILPTTPPGGFWMRVTWLPDARTMLPTGYEAEVDTSGGWAALTVYGDPRLPYAEINGIGMTDSQIVRVRSVFVTGVTSDWVTGVLP